MPIIRKEFWSDYVKLPFDKMVLKYMKPEKVRWQVKIMEHYPNTDNLVRCIKILEIPERVFNKLLKIMKIK